MKIKIFNLKFVCVRMEVNMNAEIQMGRHEKALEYAVRVIQNSTLADYVKELYLYGSYARSDYKYSSDIDLFLVLEDEARRYHSELLELKSEVTDADDFEGVDVDLKVTFGDAWRESNQFYHENIRRDGRNIWRKRD